MADRIGLVGHGRFGRAFAELCRAAKLELSIFDPHVAPSPGASASLVELMERAEVVVVAVPLDNMESAFAALAPHARRDQLVLDVGSVKLEPTRLMTRHLGERTPWVATHPLFGPASVARGERPLGVVICPNPMHPAAAGRAHALFGRLGCLTSELSAEAHDEEMAATHALTFFVAKGLLDAGLPADPRHAPPSYQGIVHTIETVRADAGHLLGPLHRHNPFARAARRRLLEALGEIDRQLERHDDPQEAAPPELAIPDLGKQPPQLRETRDLIDELDTELLDLLARRAQLSRRAGDLKTGLGVEIRDPEREAMLLAARRARAVELGLDAGAVEELFQAILTFSRAVQGEEKRQIKKGCLPGANR